MLLVGNQREYLFLNLGHYLLFFSTRLEQNFIKILQLQNKIITWPKLQMFTLSILYQTLNSNISVYQLRKSSKFKTVFCRQYFSYLTQVKKCRYKAFNFGWWGFFNTTFLSRAKIELFQKIESLFKVQRGKGKFSVNPRHDILEVCDILEKFEFATSKAVSYIQYKKDCT